jgi:hypothetical protein
MKLVLENYYIIYNNFRMVDERIEQLLMPGQFERIRDYYSH